MSERRLGVIQGGKSRLRSLADELDGELPEQVVQDDPTPGELTDEEAEEAELEEARGEARAYLGLGADAGVGDMQALFAESIHRFSEFFFPHYHEDEATGQPIEPSSMHVELLDAIQALVYGRTENKEEAFACPREHGKSVTGTLKGVLWAGANLLRRFPFVFSDTGSQAGGFMEDIREELESNTRLRAMYPDFCRFKAKPRINPHGLSRLVLGNGVVIMAAGSGKSVRGARKGSQRPDWIILDDIENDEEVENPQRRRKKMRWYMKVAKKLGRAAVYLILGTILHAESFLAQRIGKDQARIYRAVVQFPERMDLWEAWEALYHDREIANTEERHSRARQFYLDHQAQMDLGAVVLWPARFTLYELMAERAEDLASFLSERQNDPFDPAACWFPEDKLQFLGADELPSLDDVVLSIGFWDPSRGTTTSDTTAFPRLDVLRDGRRLVSAAVVDRIPPEEMVQTIVGLHKVRAFHTVGVERVGLSSYDKDLERIAKESHVSLPVLAVTPTGEKKLRIRSMRPLVVAAGLIFSDQLPREAKQQVKYYPQHPNDDLWDAIQQANRLADEMMAGVAPAVATVDPHPGGGRLDARAALGHDSIAGGGGMGLGLQDRDGDLAGWMVARLHGLN